MQQKAMGMIKFYGTTRAGKKIPLILKAFFFVKFGFNGKSMSWGDISHEDRLDAPDKVMIYIKEFSAFNYNKIYVYIKASFNWHHPF